MKTKIMQKRFAPFQAVNGLVMLILCFTTLYPVWYILINSLLQSADALRGASLWWPKSVTLDNYATVFGSGNILHAMLVSVLRTAAATSVHVFFTAMVAYPLSKVYLMGRKFYMGFGLVTMLFNGGLIPFFLLIRSLGMYDSFLVYVIPAMFSYYNMLIFRTFFKAMPDSIEESAQVDGAGDFRTFLTIVLPNAKAVIATIALFAGVYHWNDQFTGYLFIKKESLMPIQTLLFKVVAENSTQLMQQQALGSLGRRVSPNSIKFATMVIATAPILMVYPFLQRYLVQGVMLGAIKE
jgi:putative aldouronate transport system permease protein